MDIKEIIEAWIIAINPTQKQKELAELRGKVCDVCPAKKAVFKSTYCSLCGCPIGKKIFSKNFNPCTLKKWEEIDKNYITEKKEKTML